LVVALITCAATLALRLEFAVLVGSALSLGLYLHRTSRPALRSMGFERNRADAHRPLVVVPDTPGALPECPQLKLLRMEGSVYFGATAHVADRLQALRDQPDPQKHLLVMAKSMNFIDVAGAELWRQELRARRAMGGDLYFHRPRPRVLDQWQRDGFLDELGAGHVFPDKRRAIVTITRRLDGGICSRCAVRVFEECVPRRGD
jgi:SulP family sulfate permease